MTSLEYGVSPEAAALSVGPCINCCVRGVQCFCAIRTQALDSACVYAESLSATSAVVTSSTLGDITVEGSATFNDIMVQRSLVVGGKEVTAQPFGLISMWYGRVSLTAQTDVYEGPPGWYACNGATLDCEAGLNYSLPDLVGRVAIGAGVTDSSALSGNTPFSAVVPIAEHTHVFTGTPSDTKYVSDNTHNSTSQWTTSSTESIVSGLHDGTYPVASDLHVHKVSLDQYPVTPQGSNASAGVSSPIFKQVNLHYIIYLGALK